MIKVGITGGIGSGKSSIMGDPAIKNADFEKW